jgi:hypothetical protein
VLFYFSDILALIFHKMIDKPIILRYTNKY